MATTVAVARVRPLEESQPFWLLPVAGDTISLCLGLLILADARRLGALKRVLARMLLNLEGQLLRGYMTLADMQTLVAQTRQE